jgi:peroxiredoxin
VLSLERNRDALLTFHVSENEIYKRSDVLVVGVSSDSVEKQKAFVEKNKLPVRLLLKKQVMAG